MRARPLAAAAVLAVALPALAYVLPVAGILRRMGERRAALSLDAMEASGTLLAEGRSAERIAQAAGLGPSQRTQVSARLALKVPGRCRLELVPPEVPEASRPFASLREGKTGPQGALADVPAAAALLRALCTLLATSPTGDASAAYSAALGRRGVGLGEASLARFEGRVAWVVGGRAKDARPLAFVDKESFQPLRLVTQEGGAVVDVRLLDWGSPTGGDWFPRALEVWEGSELRLRFTTEKVIANPKLAEPLFP